MGEFTGHFAPVIAMDKYHHVVKIIGEIEHPPLWIYFSSILK